MENTHYALTVKKQIIIGYLGGSITVGVGATQPGVTSWRARTTRWLQESYPAAAIREFSGSVSGRGSMIGACCVGGGWLRRTRPDLLFIEYAINDCHECRSFDISERNLESIVRMALRDNPYLDIVLVYTTDDKRHGEEYEAIRAFEAVAHRYGLLSVNVGRLLLEEKGATALKKNGAFLADNVHPNDAGHAYYASCVTALLEKSLNSCKESVRTAHPLPSPGRTDLYTNGCRITAADIALSNARSELLQGSDGNGLILQSGDRVLVHMPGTAIAIRWQAPTESRLVITLNGESPQQLHGTPWGNYDVLYEGLPSGEKALSLKNETDKACTIYELTSVY